MNDNRRSYGILENIHDPVNNDLYKTLKAKDYGITNINRIYSKGKQTSSVKVTFNTPVAPTKIIAGFYMDVKPCKITLTRCNNCQVHGHRLHQCKGKTLCPHCAGPHTHAQCKTKNNIILLRCANCHQKHGAYSKQCPFYIKYKAIVDKQNNEIETRWQERKPKEINRYQPIKYLTITVRVIALNKMKGIFKIPLIQKTHPYLKKYYRHGTTHQIPIIT